MSKFNLIKDTVNLVLSHIPNFKKTNFDTILITHFNFGNDPICIDENYLTRRFEIFDKYTFSVINQQTDKNFNWLILLNPKTPKKFKERLEKYKEQSTMNMVLAYADFEGYPQSLSGIIKRHIDISAEYLITCRCDNDDMLGDEYIEKLRKNFIAIDNIFIDFVYGYSYNILTDELNLYKRRANHFVAYIEKLNKNNINTVFCSEHTNIGNKGWIRRIYNRNYPLWCEDIHETNRLNTFRGEKASEKEQLYFENHFKYKNKKK